MAVPDDALAGEAADALFAVGDADVQLEETALGDAAADAALFSSGADIAILNGGDFAANLMGGEILYADCLRVFAEDRPLALAEISPKKLRELLETGVSQIAVTPEEYIDREVSPSPGFPQIAGFTFLYDLSAPAGSRVVWIKVGGEELDMDDSADTLLLCATEYMLSGGYGYEPVSSVSGEETLSTALFSYIRHEGTISPPPQNRIHTRGSNDSALFSSLGFTPLMMIVVIACFAALGGYKLKQFYDFKR